MEAGMFRAELLHPQKASLPFMRIHDAWNDGGPIAEEHCLRSRKRIADHTANRPQYVAWISRRTRGRCILPTSTFALLSVQMGIDPMPSTLSSEGSAKEGVHRRHRFWMCRSTGRRRRRSFSTHDFCHRRRCRDQGRLLRSPTPCPTVKIETKINSGSTPRFTPPACSTPRATLPSWRQAWYETLRHGPEDMVRSHTH